MSNFSLKTIMAALAKPNGMKRTIYNQAPIGGIDSKFIVLFFFALPFLEYAAIFNPIVFTKLGIAQSIVAFIVLLVFLMQMVFVGILLNNKRVVKKIVTSWEHYFPGKDLKAVLSSGTTPYSDFFKLYKASADLEEEALHKALKEAFIRMEEENKDLVEAIKKDKSRA